MGTEDRERDERIAEAIRSMADEDGRIASPPANLWGRIERAIDDPIEQPSGLVSPPTDLWDRIAGEIRSDSDGRAPAGGRRWRTLGLAAAAVVLVVALVGALVAGFGSDGTSAELVATASLSGAGLDPGGDSTGSAELLEGSDGWQVAIQVADLPDLPSGSYYEAWLLGSQPGQVQSLGALRGDERFAVPDGVAIDDYPLVDVSIEPVDGNPGHSSKSVLRGELQTA